MVACFGQYCEVLVSSGTTVDSDEILENLLAKSTHTKAWRTVAALASGVSKHKDHRELAHVKGLLVSMERLANVVAGWDGNTAATNESMRYGVSCARPAHYVCPRKSASRRETSVMVSMATTSNLPGRRHTVCRGPRQS
jgi:hypothetical protein